MSSIGDLSEKKIIIYLSKILTLTIAVIGVILASYKINESIGYRF